MIRGSGRRDSIVPRLALCEADIGVASGLRPARVIGFGYEETVSGAVGEQEYYLGLVCRMMVYEAVRMGGGR